jgi:hypothetical protein
MKPNRNVYDWFASLKFNGLQRVSNIHAFVPNWIPSTCDDMPDLPVVVVPVNNDKHPTFFDVVAAPVCVIDPPLEVFANHVEELDK